MTKPSQVFATIMQEARLKAGISPEDLAAKLKLPHHSIKDWEAGKRAPRLDAALRWASHLGYQFNLLPPGEGHYWFGGS